MPSYKFARRDSNHTEIVRGLREYPGVGVIELHNVGRNCPDLLVAYGRVNYLFEVKRRKGKLTLGQIKLFDTWPGQVAKVETIEEILELIEYGKPRKVRVLV